MAVVLRDRDAGMACDPRQRERIATCFGKSGQCGVSHGIGREGPIMALVPGCWPLRCFSISQKRSKLAGQRASARQCSSGVEPAKAPGFFVSASR